MAEQDKEKREEGPKPTFTFNFTSNTGGAPAFTAPAFSPKSEGKGEVVNANNPEEEKEIEFEAKVKLEQVETKTLEEEEDVLFKMRAKLFRFCKEGNEWKERGVGDCKFLKHQKTDKIRILMRREKIHKLCANHLVMPHYNLEVMGNSDRAFIWTAPDYSEGEVAEEVLAIRFANAENATKFKTQFEEAQEHMKKYYDDDGSPKEGVEPEPKEGKSTEEKLAEDLDKATIEPKKD